MKDLSVKKLYYSISEVSRLTGLEQYILRYWESEFDELKPSKNRAGNRIYTNKDIKLILKIKKLLRDEKYTIEGAKKILNNVDVDKIKIPKQNNKQEQKQTNRSLKKDLEEIRKFLLDLRDQL
jgi:DNA-binding transcriptional MerR regulator